MADAETIESRVPRDERQRDEEITVQVVDVVRRQLLLVLPSLLARWNGNSGRPNCFR